MEKVLSICIPTYNRERFLRNSLETLYRQLDDKNRDYVEVLVSNNCSTDGTHELVQEYIAQGMEITYLKNDKNLGADGNFLQCIYKAKGKYVLLLGDDDLLLPGAVNTLIDILQQDNYGVVYISGTTYRGKNTPAPSFANINMHRALCNGVNEYLQKVTVNITFISGNIFNKTLLPEFSAESYKKTYLLQVPFFLHAASNATKNLYLQEKFLAIGGDGENNGGYGLYTVFGINLFAMLNEFKKYGIKDDAIKAVADYTLFYWFPGIIMAMRSRDTFKPEGIDRLEKYHGNNWRYQYVAKPMNDLPYWKAKAFYFVYRCLRKISILVGVNNL